MRLKGVMRVWGGWLAGWPLRRQADARWQPAAGPPLLSRAASALFPCPASARLLPFSTLPRSLACCCPPHLCPALLGRAASALLSSLPCRVDVKGDYVDKGFVSKDNSATANSVPALPFLVAVVVGLLGATVYVVAQTS